MKISSDWIVYYLRSFGFCDDIPNNQIGIAVKDVLAGMGCPQNPEGVQIRSPLYNTMLKELAESGFAQVGLVYDIDMSSLPEFFKKLSVTLDIKLS